MHFPQSFSLAAIALVALSFASAEPVHVVHDVRGHAIAVSAEYLASFDSELAPEPAFTLSDNASGKLISLGRRGDDSCADHYTVESGDTCHEIIKDYGISLKAFYDLNPSINRYCTNLKIGKKYCVKEGSSHKSSVSGDCTATHKVKGSDTCVSITRKYHISLNDFYHWNPTVNRGSCDNLLNGRRYCVAVSGATSKKQETSAAKKKSNNDKKKAAAAAAAAAKKAKQEEEEEENDQVEATAVTKKVTSFAAKTTPKKQEPEEEEEEQAPAKESRKKMQGSAAFTYYWIAQPDDYTGGSKVTIKTCSGKPIASVNRDYADALVMEGTGTVGNKIVNLGGCSCNNYACFEVLSRSKSPFGITAYGTALRPYVSIAANDFPRGTKIYVPQLDGWTLPGSNKKHNGCMVVEDQSWSFGSHHIDFYVYDMSAYEKLDQQHRINKVDIYEGGNCKLINYM